MTADTHVIQATLSSLMTTLMAIHNQNVTSVEVPLTQRSAGYSSYHRCDRRAGACHLYELEAVIIERLGGLVYAAGVHRELEPPECTKARVEDWFVLVGEHFAQLDAIHQKFFEDVKVIQEAVSNRCADEMERMRVSSVVKRMKPEVFF